MSDINIFTGVSFFGKIFILAIFLWPVTLGILAAIGVIGIIKRRMFLGKISIGISVMGLLALAGYFGNDAISNYLTKQRFEREYREMLSDVEHGDIMAAEKCLFECEDAEQVLKITRQHTLQAAQQIIAAYSNKSMKNGVSMVRLFEAHKIVADAMATAQPQTSIDHLNIALEVATTPTFKNYLDDPSGHTELLVGIGQIEDDLEKVIIERIIRDQGVAASANTSQSFKCSLELWQEAPHMLQTNTKEICDRAEKDWRTMNHGDRQTAP